MLSVDEIEPGSSCTHKNTGLRYSVVEVGMAVDEAVLLVKFAFEKKDAIVKYGGENVFSVVSGSSGNVVCNAIHHLIRTLVLILLFTCY